MKNPFSGLSHLSGEPRRVQCERTVEDDAAVFEAGSVDAFDAVPRAVRRLEPAPTERREVGELGYTLGADGGLTA